MFIEVTTNLLYFTFIINQVSVTYQVDIIIWGHGKSLHLLCHASHITDVGTRHSAHRSRHSRELCHWGIASVHLRVSTHRVDRVVSGISIGSTGRGIYITHHSVTCSWQYCRWQWLSYLLLLFSIFCSSVLEPYLKKKCKLNNDW